MSIRRPHEPDPEHRCRQGHANELLLAVAMRLLGEARLAGEFPTGDGALATIAARIAPDLGSDEHVVGGGEERSKLPRSDYKVVVDRPEPDSVHLICRYGSHSDFGRLRIDGVLDEQGGGVDVSIDPEQRAELSPVEQEVLRRAFARMKQGEGRRQFDFHGNEFLRVLAVQPQSGAAAQILAVELFGEGLVVRYTYDDPVDVRPRIPLEFYELAEVEPPFEELLAEAEAEGGNLAPNISLTDDLGTRYVNAGGGEGGVEVAHGEAYFTPAVPAAATRLLVSSYAGTVEVHL
jgi:hypothetical protein